MDIGADENNSCDAGNQDDIFNDIDWNLDGTVDSYELCVFAGAWLTHDPNDPGIITDPNFADDPEVLVTRYRDFARLKISQSFLLRYPPSPFSFVKTTKKAATENSSFDGQDVGQVYFEPENAPFAAIPMGDKCAGSGVLEGILRFFVCGWYQFLHV